MATKARKKELTPKAAGRRLRQAVTAREPDRKSVTIRMDPELYTELQKLAIVGNTKVSYIIEDLVAGYLGMG